MDLQDKTTYFFRAETKDEASQIMDRVRGMGFKIDHDWALTIATSGDAAPCVILLKDKWAIFLRRYFSYKDPEGAIQLTLRDICRQPIDIPDNLRL